MIDCNCFFGPRLTGCQLLGEEDFRSALDDGIGEIFISTTLDAHFDWMESNRAVITVCSRNSFLSPVVTFPLDMGVFGREREYLDLEARVYRFHTNPALSVSPEEQTLKRFLEGLADKGGVLIADYRSAPAALITKVASDYPTVPLILTGINYPEFGAAKGVFDAFPQTHMDIAHFSLFNGLEYLDRVLGTRRLVFGTNSPEFAYQANLIKLERASLSETQKRQIGEENFCKLLEGNHDR